MNAPADAPDLARLRRALVVKLRHHGDVLLTAPVFSALKAHAPHLEIDALVYADTADMLSGHPAISRLHVVDRAWKKAGLASRAAAEWTLWRTLRSRAYDLLVHLTDHRRGLWLARTLAAPVTVAPARRGDARWAGAFSHLYSLPRQGNTRHTVEVNLDALRRIGVFPADDGRRLTLVPGAAAEARAAQILRDHDLVPGGFTVLHPASRWLFKTWPAERTAQLATRLAEDGERIVMTCAPAEAELALLRRIRSQAPAQVVDLGGQLGLKDLAALIARARMFVGVDSAPMHIAAAVGTPVVALFGPSGEVEWGPWGVAHRSVTSLSHPCRPCGNDGCGGSKVSECLTTLPVSRVLDEIRSLAGGR